MSEKEEFDLSAATNVLQTSLKPIVEVASKIVPRLIKICENVYGSYMKLPQNVIEFLMGFFYCFFGGVFPTLFSAIQAAEYGGRRKFVEAIEDLAEEVVTVIEASDKDDEKDEDGDGIADVDQISAEEYVERKWLLVLKSADPNKINAAIGAIYSVWLSVAAVLCVEYAAVISMSLAVTEFLDKPSKRFIAPVLIKLTPDYYDKWIPIVLHYINKSIAISIVWTLASIRYASSSALKGGLVMARGLFKIALHRGWNLYGLIPKDHTKSNLDEFLSYGFGFLGFLFQIQSGFKVPFPLNLLLWPLQVAEFWIRWAITE